MLAYAGRRTTVRDGKGVRDLAVLLARPGSRCRPWSWPPGRGGGADGGSGGAEQLHAEGDLGEVLDARARHAYQQRLHELEEDAAEADAEGDVERSARVRHGARRPRRAADRRVRARRSAAPAGSPAERARSTGRHGSATASAASGTSTPSSGVTSRRPCAPARCARTSRSGP